MLPKAVESVTKKERLIGKRAGRSLHVGMIRIEKKGNIFDWSTSTLFGRQNELIWLEDSVNKVDTIVWQFWVGKC